MDLKPIIDALKRRVEQERAYALKQRDPIQSAQSWGCNAGLNEALVLLTRAVRESDRPLRTHHPACDPGFGPANYRCHPDCPMKVQPFDVDRDPGDECEEPSDPKLR